MSNKKRLMILGASRIQLLAIQYAKSKGYYVITCDMDEDSVGRHYADEFYQVSTSECDEVLDTARKCNVDGIMTYAADAAAPTVAFVGNELGLPSNPYQSVLTLARKDYFRDFLRENGYYVPTSDAYVDWRKAAKDVKKFKFPILIKPCDSAGSRGMKKFVDEKYDENDFQQAFDNALSFSRAKKVVIEDFIQRKECQIAGDGFVVDGKLVFRCFANEHFNKTCNTLVPIGESFPSMHDIEVQERAHKQLQSIFTKMGIRFGAFNFDFMITTNDDIFVIEIGPRNGGNLIPQVTRHATGVDMLDYTVKTALGEDCSDLRMHDVKGYYSSYMIHSKKDGVYRGVKISDELKGNIIEENIYVEPGSFIESYQMAGYALGEMILKFESMDEMLHKMDNMDLYCKVLVDGN
jgi:biotin carboxylase